MAKIPEFKINFDPTLDAVDRAIVERESKNLARPYLGASSIGRPCSRELWYQFRWVAPILFDAITHKRFEDGYRDEDLMASRLRLVPGIELWTLDAYTGHQFGIIDHGGHFRGHLDGVIRGILQAPKTPHVWEHKCTNEKKQAKLDQLKTEFGEKEALKKWDEVYYAQALIYMYYKELPRHYLTVSSPGGRTQTSCRTNASNKEAKLIVNKARRIITSPEPLERISEKPEFFQCKWCNFKAVCHGESLPAVNCRTCAHATPEMDGDGRWSCALYQGDIPTDFQRQGCTRHVYVPSLLAPYKTIDASIDENWIEYEKPDGARFRNGDGYYSSEELRVCDHAMIGDKGIEALKKPSAPDWLMPPSSTSQAQTKESENGEAEPYHVPSAPISSATGLDGATESARV
jgi:hypothetical protein